MNKWVNQVIEGDCLEVMATFPSGGIDMVLADLPYGMTRNAWDTAIDLEALWRHYQRIVKPSGVIVLTGQGLFTARLILSNPAGFRYKIAWIKTRATNFLNAKKQPLRKHEDICVFYRGKPVYHPQLTPGTPYTSRRSGPSDNYNGFKAARLGNPSGMRRPADVLFYEEEHGEDYLYFKAAGAEDRAYHATQKPVALGRYLIRTYSNEGDIILDNTCGSGSFLVAAVREGRRFIGIEKNASGHSAHQAEARRKNLIQICRERIARAYQECHPLFPYENNSE